MIKIIIVAVLLLLVSTKDLATLQLLPTTRGARCLDGSPPGFYYHKGTAPNDRKFIIGMDGGGFCAGTTLQQTLQSCYRRSKTALGSTKDYPAEGSFQSLGGLSDDPKRNPVFHDWTKIYMIYCDGSEYTGSKTDPVSYKDAQLYFRGYNNVVELFHYLDEQHDFYNGDSIVLTGVSAGGMGTYFYSNYIYERTNTAKVYSIPDSGLFLIDFYTSVVGAQVLRSAVAPLVHLINEGTTGFPIPECFQQNKEDIIECYTASNLTKYFKTPMLIIESPYDSYSIDNVVFTQCLKGQQKPFSLDNCNQTTRGVIEEYKEDMYKAIQQIRRERKDVGIWAPACAQHGFIGDDTFTDPRFKVPSETGKMLYEVVQQFLDNPENAPWYMDDQPWPSNAGCSGRPRKSLQRQ